MSAEPKRVELTEAERGQLFAAGDHHPDMCDCTDRAAEAGYAPDSEEVCEALVNTFVVVERIIASREAAARREVARLQQYADDLNDQIADCRVLEYQAKVARVEALAEDWEAGREMDPWYWSEPAEELRAALAETERDEPTSCEAGHPVQSCQGCDAGNCSMLPGFTPEPERDEEGDMLGGAPGFKYRDATVPMDADFPSEVARALLDDERLSDEEGGND